MEDNNLKLGEYLKALDKMKNSPRDRLGILGELGVTGFGVTAGFALSGAVAGAAGVATIAGSTTLAAVLGGVFVTTTPVGWVAGAAIVGGGLAYAAGKLIRSGGKCDTFRKYNIQELESRIRQLQIEARATSNTDRKMSKIITSLQYLVANSIISQQKSTELLAATEKGYISVDEAFDIVQNFFHQREICMK